MNRYSTFTKPRKPLRRVNPERGARRFERRFGSEERLRWIHRQRCSTCGAWPPSESSHVKSRATGGGPDDQIPQCRACHRELHNLGVREFERRHLVDLRGLASTYARRWNDSLKGGS